MILRREQGEGQRPHKSETPRHQDNEQNIEPGHFAKSSINNSIGLTSPSRGSMPSSGGQLDMLARPLLNLT